MSDNEDFGGFGSPEVGQPAADEFGGFEDDAPAAPAVAVAAGKKKKKKKKATDPDKKKKTAGKIKKLKAEVNAATPLSAPPFICRIRLLR